MKVQAENVIKMVELQFSLSKPTISGGFAVCLNAEGNKTGAIVVSTSWSCHFLVYGLRH